MKKFTITLLPLLVSVLTVFGVPYVFPKAKQVTVFEPNPITGTVVTVTVVFDKQVNSPTDYAQFTLMDSLGNSATTATEVSQTVISHSPYVVQYKVSVPKNYLKYDHKYMIGISITSFITTGISSGTSYSQKIWFVDPLTTDAQDATISGAMPIIKAYDTNGNHIDYSSATGLIIVVYSNGSTSKIYK